MFIIILWFYNLYSLLYNNYYYLFVCTYNKRLNSCKNLQVLFKRTDVQCILKYYKLSKYRTSLFLCKVPYSLTLLTVPLVLNVLRSITCSN